MKPKRHFLDRGKPVLDQAVSFLTAGWETGPLDLRDRLILVPTSHAGRRLRERLASVAAERDTAVLMGPVRMPSVLFAPPQEDPRPVASDVVAEAFWRKILVRCDPAQLSALGPAALEGQRAATAATAEHLCRIRSVLCEEGHDFKSFAAKTTREKERWLGLANLEQLYLAELQKESWRDDVTEKLRAACNPLLPDGVSRIVLLFLPDPPPLAIRALEALADRVAMDVCVHADAAEAGSFDAWGRPDPEKWQNRPLSIQPSQVSVCDDAVAMTELIRRCVLGVAPEKRASITVGVGDSQSAVRLAEVLGRERLSVFNPAGSPAAHLPLFTLVGRLFELRGEGTFAAFAKLARHPHALRCLEERAGAAGTLLELLDEFQNEQMPVTFQDAAALAPRFGAGAGDEAARKRAFISAALEEVEQWLLLLEGRAEGRNEPLSKALPDTLTRIYRGCPDDALSGDSIKVLRAALDHLAQLEKVCADREDSMDLLQRFLESQAVTLQRPDEAVELLGWLELAWEDAPMMLLADLNDGLIPEAVAADPFLPDSARRETGLRDNGARLARDAHTLESIVRSRNTRSVHGFMPRRSPSGDPLKPSRLLLQCESKELAERALRFFSDVSSPFVSATRGPGWLLSPPRPGPENTPRSVSVTGFRVYLDCPFRFYMERVLRVDEPYEDRAELDPREFGDVCHSVFKAFADSSVKDSRDEKEIADFLCTQTTKMFRARFGENLPLPLMIQRDILLQRMSYAATIQAGLRREGWEILDSEKSFEFAIEGMPVRGRFDRVDRNEQDGRVRVIDYKTTARASEPGKEHLGRITARSSAPVFARTPDGKQAWSDLQLPLYVRAWREANPGCKAGIEAAYFALPNAVADTDLLVWEGLDEATVKSALACAGEIVRRIRAGVFWPPATDSYRAGDTFYPLFFDRVEKFLDPAFIADMEQLVRRYEERTP